MRTGTERIAIGIDVGGSSIKAAALELSSGTVLWCGQSGRYQHPSREELVRALQEVTAALSSVPATIGLCLPGLMDAGGRVVTRAINLPALEGLDLDALIRDGLAIGSGMPPRTRIVNDAVASGYDVYISRGLSGRLLNLALGTGVGAAVLDEGGGPLRVDGDSPGHIGQADVSIEGAPVIGPDGGAGSLEGYIGAPALAARYGPDIDRALASLDVTSVPLRALARAIRICHAMYRPHHVCLSGGIGIRLANAIPDLRRVISEQLTSIVRPQWTLFAAADNHHAARGAARLGALH